MAALARAFVEVLPDTSGFSSALQRQAQQGGRRFGQQLGAAAGGAMSLAFKATGVLALIGGGVAIGQAFTDSIGKASDLNETISKVGVLFGTSAKEIEKFAASSGTALGQSKQQALDAAATFAVFGKGAGLQGPALVDFSTKLTTLASDMASFSNTSPEEAINAIGSALRGEAEPIRAYGVLLDDASLRQEALAQGIVKTTKQALTPQQKVLAVQALIFKQTAAAQGDFGRTSAGVANQQRILGAQIDNAKTTLGQAFLPALQSVTQVLTTQVVPAVAAFLQEVGPKLGPIISSAASFMIGTLFPAVGRIGGVIIDTLVPAFRAAGSFITTTLVPAFQSAGAFITGTLVPAVAGLIAWLMPRLQPALAAIKEGMATVGTTISTTLVPLVESIRAKFVEWSPQIEATKTFLVNLAEMVLTKVVPVLIEFYSKYVSKVITALAGIVTAVGEVIKFVGNFIGKFNDAKTAVGDFVTKIGEGVGKIKTAATNIYNAINDALGGLPGKVLEIGGDIVSGLWNGIQGMQGWLKDRILGFAKAAIPDALEQFFGIASPARLMIPLGEFITMGLAKGIWKGKDRVKKATRDMGAEALKAAQVVVDKMRAKGQAVLDLAKQTSDGVRSGMGVTAFQKITDQKKVKGADGKTETVDVERKVNAKDVIAQFRARVQQAQRFAVAVEKLRKAGLNKSSLMEIISAGPAGGLEIANALIAGGIAAVKETNQLEKMLVGAGGAVANTATQAQFGMSIKEGRALAGTTVKVEKGAIVVTVPGGTVDAATRKQIETAVTTALTKMLRESKAGSR